VAEKGPNKAQVFADMPYSTGQLEMTWFQLCCFEDGFGCQIPDSRALLTSWKSLITASTAASLPITTVNRGELWEALREDMPLALFDQLLSHATDTRSDGGAALISWSGQLLLKVKVETDRMEFREEWRELLPEDIITETNVDMTLLRACADLSDPTLVKLKRATLPKTALATASKTGSREWHERFGRANGK
jgi:hypothetical protein